MTPTQIFTCLLAGLTATLSARPVTIPFQITDELIIVQATVDGQNGNFILDSGIPKVVLNRSYFKGRPDLTEKAGCIQSINGPALPCEADYIQLHLYGMQIRSYATIVDLSSIEKQKKIKLLGLIGLCLFQDQEIAIDFFTRQIILYNLDRNGNRLAAEGLPAPSMSLPLKKKGHIPWITVWMVERKLKLGLDTGAVTNILLSSTKTLIMGDRSPLGVKVSMGLNGNQQKVSSAHVVNLKVGDLTLPAMETIFLSIDPMNKLLGPQLDGVLGLEFMKHFRVAFNFKKKMLYLWNQPTNGNYMSAREKHQ